MTFFIAAFTCIRIKFNINSYKYKYLNHELSMSSYSKVSMKDCRETFVLISRIIKMRFNRLFHVHSYKRKYTSTLLIIEKKTELAKIKRNSHRRYKTKSTFFYDYFQERKFR